MKEIIRNISTVNYQKGIVPEDYKCDKCKCHGVKLWRENVGVASLTKLLCAECAEKSEKKGRGKNWQSSFKLGEGYQIGYLLPAVPVEGQNTYWGITSGPKTSWKWWHNLPVKI